MIKRSDIKFGHCTLSSELWNDALNTKFIAAVGMLRKKLNHHSEAVTISKLSVHSQFIQNNFSVQKLDFNLTSKCQNFGQGVRT